jgi:hypothetical protein
MRAWFAFGVAVIIAAGAVNEAVKAFRRLG